MTKRIRNIKIIKREKIEQSESFIIILFPSENTEGILANIRLFLKFEYIFACSFYPLLISKGE